tara:strand:+ start:240 stop:866 length:627 start_codon:yes stop_codon:yes gene_type:complete
MLEETSVQSFLDKLASNAATPGGGSAAAVLGAMGAGLLSMVCNLTIGKKAYAEVEDEMKGALAEAESLRTQLQANVQADIDAFEQVMSAYAMPRGSDEERAARSAAIQSALKTATLVPLECARACGEVIALAGTVAEKGNKQVVSDAGVGVVAAHAALRSAALNVYINTASINDEAFATEQLEALEAILEASGRENEVVYSGVVRALQ